MYKSLIHNNDAYDEYRKILKGPVNYSISWFLKVIKHRCMNGIKKINLKVENY